MLKQCAKYRGFRVGRNPPRPSFTHETPENLEAKILRGSHICSKRYIISLMVTNANIFFKYCSQFCHSLPSAANHLIASYGFGIF